MSILSAYVGVILIWATTPLAVKWSGEHQGFLFGISVRMALAAVICLLIMAVLQRPLPWRGQVWRAYVAVSIGLFGSMSCVYWSAQFIPSGLISVVFGLSPLFTAVIVRIWLHEQSLSPFKLLGMGLGVLGLSVIFVHDLQLGGQAWKGLLGVLLATFLHSLSGVAVKQCGSQVTPLALTTGGLLVSLPLFGLAWWASGQAFPTAPPLYSLLSIVYLAVFGSVLGFMLYFYLLHQLAVTKVALITLVTPICALLLGQLLNGETIMPIVWLGTVLVLTGLAVHQWSEALCLGIARCWVWSAKP